jgi:hypothetical protein
MFGQLGSGFCSRLDQVRSLRYTTGNLAANTLFETTKALEKVIIDGDNDKLSELLNNFEKDIEQLVESASLLSAEDNAVSQQLKLV